MEEERVREEIRQLIQDIYDWPYQLGDGAFNEWADEILAIKGIRIEADDQTIVIPCYQDGDTEKCSYINANPPSWVTDAGFVGVLPKKE